MWLLDLPSGRMRLDHAVVVGSRPLSVRAIEGLPGFADGLYYGEYWENEHKDPVNIWCRDRLGAWRVVHTFPKGAIEHVHAVIPDKLRGWVWILAGDFGQSAGIWVAREGFREVRPLLAGKQEYRCCWLAQLGDRIVYATDSPLERNSVRELRITAAPEGLQAASLPLVGISGSSIYSCMVGDRVVFSTTVEPGLLTGAALRDLLDRSIGPGIEGPYADLMAADSHGITHLGRWHKDRWPSRLCEFGSISFPTGTNPGSFAYAYYTALTSVDGCMSVFDLECR